LSPSAAAAASTEASVAPEATVITINGVCNVSATGLTSPARAATKTGTTAKSAAGAASASPGSADCKTHVTRAQFEKLIKSVAPTAPPTARRQIASRYAQLLVAANEGEKLGVDKEPEFKDQLALMRLQLLAQDAERKLQANAANVSDADGKAYFDQNPSAFQEVTLTRIFIPRSSGDNKTGAPDAKAVADTARQQLASGGDPEKLEKDAYAQLKLTTDPPSTKFGAKRRGTLPPAHEQQVFSLKQGETSQVIPDSVGYVIYRVDSQQQLPYDQVKEEVKRKLTQQHLQDQSQQIFSSAKTDYNEAYFGPDTAPRPPSMSRPGDRPAPPGAAGPGAAGAGTPPPTAPSGSSQPQSQPQLTSPK
jgi:hypothetical protein